MPNSSSKHRSPTSPSDQSYWDSYYATAHPSISAPSSFATFCAELLTPSSSIFELGCGNGRDVRYFASLGHRVTACDRSSVAIANLGESLAHANLQNPPELVVGEMGSLAERSAPLDVVYSRFTLHAVAAEEASLALRWSYRNLGPGGRLLAEARSVKGSLYGQGTEVARDTYLHNQHTRRFLRLEELLAELREIGFTIVQHVEADGLSVYKDDDPVVIRVVARK